jgi:hypothetical protein
MTKTSGLKGVSKRSRWFRIRMISPDVPILPRLCKNPEFERIQSSSDHDRNRGHDIWAPGRVHQNDEQKHMGPPPSRLTHTSALPPWARNCPED